MAAATRPTPSSISGLLLAATGATALIAAWFRFPAAVVVWAGVLLTAWCEPAVPLTGPKIGGRVTVAGVEEEKKLEKYSRWVTVRWAVLPSAAWLPGKTVWCSWVAGVAAAGVVWWQPVEVAWEDWARPANAAAMFSVLAGLAYAQRRSIDAPGVGVLAARQYPKRAAIGAGVGVVVLLAGWWWLTGVWSASLAAVASGWVIPPHPAGWVAAGLLGGVLGLWGGMWGPATSYPSQLYARRKEWGQRWRDLKMEPAPHLVEFQQVGDFTLEVFSYRGLAADIIKTGDVKIAPLLGAGLTVGFFPQPDPSMVGMHPNMFIVAQCPSGAFPDLMDGTLPDEVRQTGAWLLWSQRWKSLKIDPAPVLRDTVVSGGARIDTFMAAPQFGAPFFLALTGKIASFAEPGTKLAILPVWEGGVAHPSLFRVVTWVDQAMPSLSDPSVPAEQLGLLLDCALAWCLEPYKVGIPHVTRLDNVAEEGGVLWRVEVAGGIGWQALRKEGYASLVAGALGAGSLVNHRDSDGGPAWFVGDVDTAPVPDDVRELLFRLSNEDTWNATWTAALKQGVYPPTLQHTLVKAKELPGVGVVHAVSFAPLQGRSTQDFDGYEAKLATVLSAQFIAKVGFIDPNGKVPGERHPQLFTIIYSARRPPVVSRLRPTVEDAYKESASLWVLRGMVASAFKSARCSQPEVMGVRCLTGKLAQSHIWQIDVRLYGGDTLATVRGVREKLRQAFGVPWLRVAPHEFGVSLFVGEEPSKVRLVNPADKRLIDDLDWTQAFIDAGITSRSGGLLPALRGVEVLEHNPKVKVLDFVLPPGLAVSNVRDRLEQLKTAVGCEFLSPSGVAGDATLLRVMACESDPMPSAVGLDAEVMRRSAAIPFGEAVDGSPVVFDVKTSPHLLVAGGTGSGKSSVLKVLVVGALMRGMEVFIADPMKAAADFRFAEPWCRSVVDTIADTAGLLRGVYAEVERRRAVNAQFGAASYRDVPAEVRPAHMVVVVDEFTSLIQTDKTVGRSALEDPEAEAQRLLTVAENNDRLAIGQLVAKIAREARSAGVTLLLGAQKLTGKALDAVPGGDSLKINLARIMLGTSTFGDRVSALRLPEFAPDLGTQVPIGRGLFESSVAAAVAFQGYWAESSVLVEVLERSGVGRAVPFDVSGWVKKAESSSPVQEVSVDVLGGGEPVAVEVAVEDVLGDLDFGFDEGDGDGGGSDGGAGGGSVSVWDNW